MTWPIVLTDLFEQYLFKGDFFGFIDGVYLSIIGRMWYVFPLLFIFVPLYIKTQSLEFCAILWILVGGALIALLPAQAATVGTLFLVLGIAVLLYKLAARIL